jgi:phosphatidylglycerol lysyltransferase
MSLTTGLTRQREIKPKSAVVIVSLIVGLHGVFILATSLLDQININRGAHFHNNFVDLPIFLALSLMYLSTLLRRRKRTAWIVTVLTYAFYLGLGLANIFINIGIRYLTPVEILRALLLPGAILILLFVLENDFVVHSDIQGFRAATRFACIMLLVALIYGVTGFSLLDNSDFHQEISFPTALHYTVDQFDLTTTRPIHPYTRRAKYFVNSLSFVSVGAVAYVIISLFQPLRFRLSEQNANRKHMYELMMRFGGSSEDYFKLWPHDKQYFFDDSELAGLAFRVHHGIALCLGDPVGKPNQLNHLLQEFDSMCFSNDWLPAYIHVEKSHKKLYEKNGFALQKIGQEAVLNLGHFEADVRGNKYFRNIRNKFTKQGYTTELLMPPHHQAVISRINTISDEWLSVGGRVERGFAMGYFSTDYMQDCPIMVVRDAAGTIQAFINQLPTDFNTEEANFDLLRHTKHSLGNINDFLLLGFIAVLVEKGYQRLNMGLCPLVGLTNDDEIEKNGLIDGVLRFAYANGDRFYSFSGLYRFKSKFEPEWRDRFIAYRSGIRGFSMTTNALMRAMRVKTK